jgi:hypothetical protein
MPRLLVSSAFQTKDQTEDEKQCVYLKNVNGSVYVCLWASWVVNSNKGEKSNRFRDVHF